MHYVLLDKFWIYSTIKVIDQKMAAEFQVLNKELLMIWELIYILGNTEESTRKVIKCFFRWMCGGI